MTAYRSKLPVLSVRFVLFFLDDVVSLDQVCACDVCIGMHFRVSKIQEGTYVCSICLYFNRFIFIANVKFRPEVTVIKL